MVEFFLAGGPPMAFVLVVGFAGLIAAGRFMRTPDSRRVPGVIALTAAMLFAALTGFAADVSAVAHRVAGNPEWHGPDFPFIVLQGISESMSPLILGGAFGCVTWLVMAVGFRRLVARQPPAA